MRPETLRPEGEGEREKDWKGSGITPESSNSDAAARADLQKSLHVRTRHLVGPDGRALDPCRRQYRRGQKIPPTGVYTARPSRWGNPWKVEHVGRRTAVENYREALLAGRLEVTVADVQRELRGRDLYCYCGPFDECHGDVLLLVAAGVCPQCAGSGEEQSTLWDAPICKACGGTGVIGDA